MLGAAIQIVVGLLAAALIAPALGASLVEWTRQQWNAPGIAVDSSTSTGLLPGGPWRPWLLAGCWLLPGWIALWLVGAMQGGWAPARANATGRLWFRPWTVWRNSLSAQRLLTIVGQILALLAVVVSGTWLVGSRSGSWFSLDADSPGGLATQLLGVTLRAGGLIGGVLFVAGLGDWILQRWCWQRRQMMTDEELREDARQDEAPRAGRRRPIAGARPLDGINSVNSQ